MCVCICKKCVCVCVCCLLCFLTSRCEHVVDARDAVLVNHHTIVGAGLVAADDDSHGETWLCVWVGVYTQMMVVNHSVIQ